MIGTGELVIIFLVVLLLFGGKRLPDLARSLGEGIREFKRACSGNESSDKRTLPQDVAKKNTEDPQ